MYAHITNPDKAIAEIDQSIRDGKTRLISFDFDHQATYLKPSEVVALTCICLVDKHAARFAVVKHTVVTVDLALDAETGFSSLLKTLGTDAWQLQQAWPLSPVEVPKPWGAEIWYTGMENRGICQVGKTPLPWLLAAMPQHCLGSGFASPLLLKILAPLPNERLGDLYFELHEEKTEVYVVTHVDGAVWPDGVGQIRYGFNQDLLASYASDTEFKAAYLEAVRAYESVRRTIDARLDEIRVAAGVSLDEPVLPQQLLAWEAELPDTMIQSELDLREAMNAFTHLKSIRVGDIIRVEPHFPHSLQHGVRVVEFQTAHYERHILSFAQKVLTQGHWDTETALNLARIGTPGDLDRNAAHPQPGVRLDLVAEFEAFTALRIELNDNTEYKHSPGTYGVAICISGEVEVNSQLLGPEQACFIPASSGVIEFSTNKGGGQILLALPGSPAGP